MKGRRTLKKTPYTPPLFGAPSELDEVGCAAFAGSGGGGGGELRIKISSHLQKGVLECGNDGEFSSQAKEREIFYSAIAATIEASKILAWSSDLKTEPKYTFRTRNKRG
jgi:hypothetical protein